MNGGVLFSLEQGNDKEQHHGAYDGDDKLPKETGFLNVEQAHEPATEETADHADDDVDNQAEAAAFHQLASQPAGYCADEQEKNNTYYVHSF